MMQLVHGLLGSTQRQNRNAEITSPLKDVTQPGLAHIQNILTCAAMRDVERDLQFAVRDRHPAGRRELALRGIVNQYRDYRVVGSKRRDGVARSLVCTIEITKDDNCGVMRRHPSYPVECPVQHRRITGDAASDPESLVLSNELRKILQYDAPAALRSD